MQAPTVPIRRLGALLAVVAVSAAALFALSTQGVRAEQDTGPPAVQSGSAKSNCLRILEAGYAPRDYVLVFGSWWFWPAWNGSEGARMSSVWGSVAECRQLPDPDEQANVADVDQPQPAGASPAGYAAPATSGGGATTVVTTSSGGSQSGGDQPQPIIREPQPVRIVPASDSGPKFARSTTTTFLPRSTYLFATPPTGTGTDVIITSDSIPLNIERQWPDHVDRNWPP